MPPPPEHPADARAMTGTIERRPSLIDERVLSLALGAGATVNENNVDGVRCRGIACFSLARAGPF
jgi:hypothetical protein